MFDSKGGWPSTKDPVGIAPDWHLQGGGLAPWNSSLHSGFLGVAHKHGPYGQNHVTYGSVYISSFFLISSHETFELLKLTKPFCFSSLLYPDKCELIQFVTSVVVSKGYLIIGYGVNDCEARFWSIPVEEVDNMLAADGYVSA